MDLKKGRRQPFIIAAVFCIWIFGFAAAAFLRPPDEYSEMENRMLAQRPRMEAETVWNGEFERDYEEYLTDQFPLRVRWIGLKTAVERLLFKRESKDIYFGEDDYLIEKHTGVFSSQTASRNITVLAEFARQYADKLGPEHVSILLIPNAVDILQGKLPPFAKGGGGRDYLEQVAKEVPEGVWLDTAELLSRHQEEEIYYRTDHHWKTLAAFYVYQAWAGQKGWPVPGPEDYEVRTVTEYFEGTVQAKLGIRTAGDSIELFLPTEERPCTVEREGAVSDELYAYAALETKDKYAVYFGGNEPFIRLKTGADNGRRILVIKDSYANCFVPFMTGEFQEIDMIDLRYTNEKINRLIPEGGYTDILVLYNVSGFAEDMNIVKLIRE